MPCPFPEHHGSNGGGFNVLLTVLAAVMIIAVIGPLIHAIEIAIVVIVVVVIIAIIAGAFLVARQIKREEAEVLRQVRQRREALSTPPPAIEQRQMHLHLHGVTDEQVAALLHQQDQHFIERMRREDW